MDFTEEEMEWGHDYYHLKIMELRGYCYVNDQV